MNFRIAAKITKAGTPLWRQPRPKSWKGRRFAAGSFSYYSQKQYKLANKVVDKRKRDANH